MLLTQYKKLIDKAITRFPRWFHFSSPKPENIILNLTSRCNLHCQHCDIWQTPDQQNELTTEEWFNIIDNLAEWTTVPEITLNGGEILLRPDIIQIIDHLQKSGFKKITLNTNGTLINEAMAKNLAEKNLFKIEISLYSLSAEVHDALRGTPGAWQKTREALEYLLKYKKELKKETWLLIALLVNEKNYREIPEIIEWASARGAWVSLQALDINFHLPGVMTGGGMWHKEHPLWPKNFAEFRKVWQKVIYMKRQGKNIYNRLIQLQLMEKYYQDPFSINGLTCHTGEKNFIIDSHGQVFLCFRRGAVGSLSDQKPAAIWQGTEAKIRRDEIRVCQLTCRLMNCNYKSTVLTVIPNLLRDL